MFVPQVWAYTSHFVFFENFNSLLAFMPIFFRSKGLCYFNLLDRVPTSAMRAGWRVGAVVLKIFVLVEHTYFAVFFFIFYLAMFNHIAKYCSIVRHLLTLTS